jgi:hypothetical protein
MKHVLAIATIALIAFASFQQECRILRIRWRKNFTYQFLFRTMMSDATYVGSYVALLLALISVPLFVSLGYRIPQNLSIYAVSAILLVASLVLRAIGFKRLYTEL